VDPTLALIIPSCDRPDDLAACLESVDASAPPALRQVVVVDDGMKEPVEVDGQVAGATLEVVRNPRTCGAAFSRNRALERVGPSIDLVGFLDDDVRVEEHWFEAALEEMSPDRGAVTGPVQRFDESVLARARQLRYDRRYAGLQHGDRVDFLAGGNSVVWRHALVAVDGFPETPTMSDTLLLRRLAHIGLGCHFIPKLKVWHRNSKGLVVAVREAWRAGRVQAHKQIDYRKRSAGHARSLRDRTDRAANLVNVALDGIFLTAHAGSRTARRATGSLDRAHGVTDPWRPRRDEKTETFAA
jgi:GT2 family glycosyltransferase